MGSPHRIPPQLYEGETPQAVLRSCHDHTRMHLRAAEDLVTVDSTTAPAHAIAEVASDLRGYFANVLPVHENDECSSVIPALPRDASLGLFTGRPLGSTTPAPLRLAPGVLVAPAS